MGSFSISLILYENGGYWMDNGLNAITISEEEKNIMISRLVDELPVLRTKMGVSQDELANMIGISRQTYSSLETRKRKMTWSIFLSLLLVFDYNEQTHNVIHKEELFPKVLQRNKHTDGDGQTLASFVSIEGEDIKNHLDEQAIHAIETVIMVEYARCNNISGEAVIKAFDGKNLIRVSQKDLIISKALKNIKSNSSQ